MSPNLVLDQVAYMLGSDAVFASKGRERSVLRRVLFTDTAHLVIGQLCAAVALALSCAALRFRVLHVVGMRSEEQVIGPDARRGIAVMQDQNSFRDRAVRQFPGNAVRKQCTAMARYTDIAVAVPIGGPSPEPAGIRFAYSTPESESDWLRVSTLPCAEAAQRAEPLIRSSAGPSKLELSFALLARTDANDRRDTMTLHRGLTSVVPSSRPLERRGSMPILLGMGA